MKTLSLDHQKKQNTNLFNSRMSTSLTRDEVLEFCKRARIDICCELIDDEVKDAFLDYYGWLPLSNINNRDNFEMVKIY